MKSSERAMNILLPIDPNPCDDRRMPPYPMVTAAEYWSQWMSLMFGMRVSWVAWRGLLYKLCFNTVNSHLLIQRNAIPSPTFSFYGGLVVVQIKTFLFSFKSSTNYDWPEISISYGRIAYFEMKHFLDEKEGFLKEGKIIMHKKFIFKTAILNDSKQIVLV